jgi:hypothetical protein
MARLQFSNTLRNARVNLVETTLGTSPKLRIMSGTIPTNVAAVETDVAPEMNCRQLMTRGRTVRCQTARGPSAIKLVCHVFPTREE